MLPTLAANVARRDIYNALQLAVLSDNSDKMLIILQKNCANKCKAT